MLVPVSGVIVRTHRVILSWQPPDWTASVTRVVPLDGPGIEVGKRFEYDVLSQDDDRTLARQSIDQRGPIGVAVGLLMLRLTKRYLALEAAGLKHHSERLRRRASSR